MPEEKAGESAPAWAESGQGIYGCDFEEAEGEGEVSRWY